MSRRDRLKGLFDDTAQELAAANLEEAAMRGPAGPVRSMALTLGRMEEETKATCNDCAMCRPISRTICAHHWAIFVTRWKTLATVPAMSTNTKTR